MIMSFKVLKYFTTDKISFSLFASLWWRDFKLEKLMFFGIPEVHNSRIDRKW